MKWSSRIYRCFGVVAAAFATTTTGIVTSTTMNGVATPVEVSIVIVIVTVIVVLVVVVVVVVVVVLVLVLVLVVVMCVCVCVCGFCFMLLSFMSGDKLNLEIPYPAENQKRHKQLQQECSHKNSNNFINPGIHY